MDATTMAKISSLVAKLRHDFPEVTLTEADDFYWSPGIKTVYFVSSASKRGAETLLHEMSHAVLGHTQFRHDIDLLKVERQAWDYARETLGPRYEVEIDAEMIETMIDTYRDWLHARSTCPHCTMTGVQTADATYLCLGCNHRWRVNDARRCGLKRYQMTS